MRQQGSTAAPAAATQHPRWRRAPPGQLGRRSSRTLQPIYSISTVMAAKHSAPLCPTVLTRA